MNSVYVETKKTDPEIGLFIMEVSDSTDALSYCYSFNLLSNCTSQSTNNA